MTRYNISKEPIVRRQLHIMSLAVTLLLGVIFAAHADGAPKPKRGDGSSGANQMAGGTGKFGVTYTLTDHNGFVINYTILSAAYKIEPTYLDKNSPNAPNSEQKVLEIHYKVKNPNKLDTYYNGNDFLQLVDSTDQTIATNDGCGRNVLTDEQAAGTLKPGQGIDDIVTYAYVPAKGAVSKLILTIPRLGVNEKVLRFPLGIAPNLVKSLPALYADPSDPTGVTAAAQIPAKFDTPYVSGFFTISVSAPKLVDGNLGDSTPDQGKKFCTAAVTLTNATKRPQYIGREGNVNAVLTDTDGDSINANDNALKPAHDDSFEAREFDPGASALFRSVFVISSDAVLKQLKINTPIDNTGHVSQTLVYDVSGIK